MRHPRDVSLNHPNNVPLLLSSRVTANLPDADNREPESSGDAFEHGISLSRDGADVHDRLRR